MTRLGNVAAAAVALAMTAVPAVAAEKDGAGDRVLQSFAQCRAVADAAQRLACFDSAASALEQAVKTKEVRIIDKEDVRRTRRSLFGFTLPRVGLFGDGDKDEREEFTEINTTVASARQLDNGRVELRLTGEEDAVWQTTEAVAWPPKPGDKIRIRKGAIGSYFVTFSGKTFRGMRVR
ncbi:MAG: hypothetical protein K0R56_2300 [Sphingomonas sp.]|jgi:hypothetical protein|nr:hypothetical protein [Sphingomonas sp.]